MYTTCCQVDCINLNHLVFEAPREAKKRSLTQFRSFEYLPGMNREKIRENFVALKFSGCVIIQTTTFITFRKICSKFKGKIVGHSLEDTNNEVNDKPAQNVIETIIIDSQSSGDEDDEYPFMDEPGSPGPTRTLLPYLAT